MTRSIGAEIIEQMGEINAKLAEILKLLLKKQLGGIMASPATISKALTQSLIGGQSTTGVPHKEGALDPLPAEGQTVDEALHDKGTTTAATQQGELARLEQPWERYNLKESGATKIEVVNFKNDYDSCVVAEANQTKGFDGIISIPQSINTIKVFYGMQPTTGTLIVCPASVDGQWAQQWDKKIAVPKQHWVEGNDEKLKHGELNEVPSAFFVNNRRSSIITFRKGNKGIDIVDLDTLAKVKWSRVVWDKSQTITDHLTGDNDTCSATQCKELFGAHVVFTRSTLRRSLPIDVGDESGVLQRNYISCKIKFALDILMTHCISKSQSSESLVEDSLPPSLELLMGPLRESVEVLAWCRTGESWEEREQLLVWTGQTFMVVTWIDRDNLQAQFPHFNLADKVVSNGGGIFMKQQQEGGEQEEGVEEHEQWEGMEGQGQQRDNIQGQEKWITSNIGLPKEGAGRCSLTWTSIDRIYILFSY